MALMLHRFLLPLLAFDAVFACEVAVGLCGPEDDDLQHSHVLSLLQTQMEFATHGQTSSAVLLQLAAPATGYGSTCLATCLFGVFVVMGFAGYLANTCKPVTQASFWIVFSKVVAAFCAALFVACFRDVTTHFAPQWHDHIFSSCLRLAVIFLAVKAPLYLVKEEESLRAVATLGAFALGFAGIDVVNGVLMLNGTEQAGINFAQSPGSAAVGTFCLLGVMLVVMYGLKVLRGTTEVWDSHAGWLEQNEEAEDDAFAITAGFLICQVTTFAVMDKLYPVAENLTKPEAAIPSVAFAVVTLLFAWWLAMACSIWSSKRLRESRHVHRWEYLVVRTVSMTLAWCVLRWGHLVFRGLQERWFADHDPMLAKLFSALILSVCVSIYILVLTMTFKESKEAGTPDFQVLSGSIGLLIGQSWVGCYFRPPTGDAWDNFIQISFSCALLLIVIPVWKEYILPRVTKLGSQHTPTIDALLAAGKGPRLP